MDKVKRLDIALFDRNLVKSRQQGHAAICGGYVTVNGNNVLKPSLCVNKDDILEVDLSAFKYVSRGGYKLEKALKCFEIDISGQICLDAGASTGGFTDCMLQNGAKLVYAVDCGAEQLDKRLVVNPHVRSFENTDIRKLPSEIACQKFSFISADLSFISLKCVLPSLISSLDAENGSIVALLKPQFEMGSKHVGKNGVVRDKGTHLRIVNDVLEHVKALGFTVNALTFSPITGQNGNIEYLLHIEKHDKRVPFTVSNVVNEAFLSLKS